MYCLSTYKRREHVFTRQTPFAGVFIAGGQSDFHFSYTAYSVSGSPEYYTYYNGIVGVQKGDGCLFTSPNEVLAPSFLKQTTGTRLGGNTDTIVRFWAHDASPIIVAPCPRASAVSWTTAPTTAVTCGDVTHQAHNKTALDKNRIALLGENGDQSDGQLSRGGWPSLPLFFFQDSDRTEEQRLLKPGFGSRQQQTTIKQETMI